MTQTQQPRGNQGENADFERFQIHSRLEIIGLLQEAARAHSLVTIYFNDGAEFIITNLLAVNPDEEELIYDHGKDPAANQRMLESESMTVVTFAENIRLEFPAYGVEATRHEKRPAFKIAIPESLLRLQRRDDYRIRIPTARPLMASVATLKDPRKRLQLPIRDLSCGGIALVALEEELPAQVGMLLEDCVIDLPEVAKLTATLEVRSLAKLEDNAAGKLMRYGCRFHELSPALMNLVQRYIAKFDREHVQRR